MIGTRWFRKIYVLDRAAIKKCQEGGGINVHIIGTSDSPGCGALAAYGDGPSRIFGCSFSQLTQGQADKLALEQCKRNGGKDPQIKARWCQGKQGMH